MQATYLKNVLSVKLSPVKAMLYLPRMRGCPGHGLDRSETCGVCLQLLTHQREKHRFLVDPSSSQEQLEGRNEGTRHVRGCVTDLCAHATLRSLQRWPHKLLHGVLGLFLVSGWCLQQHSLRTSAPSTWYKTYKTFLEPLIK